MRIPAAARLAACSLRDLDGSLTTADDRGPLPGQIAHLRQNYSRIGSPRTTAADGCVTWGGLSPGQAYGVEFTTFAGWQPLTSVVVDFGVASPGELYSAEMIAAPPENQVRLPVLRR
jgi:hypothetical protein